VQLKDPKDWKLVGKRLARLDTVDKVTGKQVYGADLKLPGMLNAAIKDCPVFGGKVKSFNAAAIANRPGVKKVVRSATAPSPWWPTPGGAPRPRSTRCRSNGTRAERQGVERHGGRHAEGRADAPEAAVGNQQRRCQGGAGLGASRVVEAVYSYPHQNHATMEPMNATARWTPQRCEVWTPTQNGEAALAAAAEAAGLPPAQCEVYKLHLGGGFGRRGAVHDWVRQAVEIAKEMPGTPVKLLWTREEDMLHGRYHPITQCKLRAGLDAQGNVTALHMRISGQSILAGVFAAEHPGTAGPGGVPGPEPAGAGSVDRLRLPQPADRPCDAQPAGAAGLLARREPEPEHDLPRVLHRRGRACDPSRTRWRCAAS
jgi:isoquinoline 1-oxidoreductase beta subunit